MKNCTYTLKSTDSENERLTVQAKQLYGGTNFIDPYLLDSQMKILDIGCGTGVISKYISEKMPFSQVIGVDHDDTKISINNEHNTLSNLCFKTADVYNLPFKDETFDLCFCRFMLMHLADPLKAINEMKRVTRKGGNVVAHEGFHDAIWIVPQKKAFEKFLSVWKEKMAASHQDHSIGLKLHTMFNMTGFATIEHKVLPHSFTGNDSLIETYLNNWKKHIPSLKDTLFPFLTEKDVEEINNELNSFSTADFCLELTVLVCGQK